MCNEAMKEMAQKISVSENHEVELIEEKKKIEEDLEKARCVICVVQEFYLLCHVSCLV